VAQEFILGDSRPYVVNLSINGAPFPIDPLTSSIKAAIVTSDKKKLLAGPITLASTSLGADWSISKLIVKFPRAATSDVKVTGEHLLEVQVTLDNTDAQLEDDDWTWFIPVELVKGNIP
jgi:hypothetical protein